MGWWGVLVLGVAVAALVFVLAAVNRVNAAWKDDDTPHEVMRARLGVLSMSTGTFQVTMAASLLVMDWQSSVYTAPVLVPVGLVMFVYGLEQRRTSWWVRFRHAALLWLAGRNRRPDVLGRVNLRKRGDGN